MSCPLCAEPMLRIVVAANRCHQRLECSCCRQSICQSCLYRHIRSVWEEGITGNGRKQLVCPMGCGQAISDAEIRSCLRRQHTNLLRSWIGYQMLQHLVSIGWFEEASIELRPLLRNYVFRFFYIILYCWAWCTYQILRLSPLMWFFKAFQSIRIPKYYNYWLHLATSKAERIDLQRYEQWSLKIALQNMQSIQHCPSPGCNFSWEVSSPEYRRAKFQHESQRLCIWYKPPIPEPPTNMMIYWLEAAHLRGRLPHEEEESIQNEMRLDGRFMICAKCHCKFCGLCRQPWNSSKTNKCGKQHLYSHLGVSCETYWRQSHNSFHVARLK